MSPSKSAGGTVETGVDGEQVDANGHPSPSGNGHQESATPGTLAGGNGGKVGPSRPRRRSTLTPGRAVSPERGSASTRGVSSSSVTRRAVTVGSAPVTESTEISPVAESTELGPVVVSTEISPSDREVVATGETAASGQATPETVITGTPGDQPMVLTDPPFPEPESLLAPPLPPLPTARVDPNARRSPGSERPGMPTVLPVAVPAGTPAARTTGLPGFADRPIPPPDAPYVTTVPHQIAPVPRLLGRRPRVRRVTRVVRHVDPWSVFKVAIVFNLVLYAVLLTAGVLLWNVANATGTVDNLERFFESFGWSDFEFDGGAIYHAGWIAGLFGVIGLTGAAVLAATLFNLITDLVGGVRMTVLEEEVVERTVSPMRRFVVRRPTGGGIDPEAGMRQESDRLPVPQDPIEDPER